MKSIYLKYQSFYSKLTKSGEVLLVIKKYTDKLIGKTKLRPEETLKLKWKRSRAALTLPTTLKLEEGKWNLGVNVLEVFVSNLNNTKKETFNFVSWLSWRYHYS